LSRDEIAVLYDLIWRDVVMVEFADPVEEIAAIIPTCRSQKTFRMVVSSGAVKKWTTLSFIRAGVSGTGIFIMQCDGREYG
jgi:hypothetical protein